MAAGSAADGAGAAAGAEEAAGRGLGGQSSPTSGAENGETIEMRRRGSDAEAAEVETRQPGSVRERLLLGLRRALCMKDPPPPGTQNRCTLHT